MPLLIISTFEVVRLPPFITRKTFVSLSAVSQVPPVITASTPSITYAPFRSIDLSPIVTDAQPEVSSVLSEDSSRICISPIPAEESVLS
ncbi:MAG: hypothetical protein LUG26_03905 [Ruminococcus sp.]|nr:hypothetical protein [Ruminococcus sp.]